MGMPGGIAGFGGVTDDNESRHPDLRHNAPRFVTWANVAGRVKNRHRC